MARLLRSAACDRPSRWARDPLFAASWLCLAVLLIWVLAILPVLALAVAVPMVMLFRCASQLSWWQQMAVTDATTGLLNAYGWQQRTGAVLGGNDVGLAVVVIDVDRFKWINDRFGHQAGDAALTAIGATVAGSIRTGDIAARLGGDEFVVALRGVAAAELADVAERLRLGVAALQVRLPDAVMLTGLSTSIGAAVCPTGVTAVRELLTVADAALYEAKAAGRNTLRLTVMAGSGCERSGGAGETAALSG